jgi:hypothetical protein
MGSEADIDNIELCTVEESLIQNQNNPIEQNTYIVISIVWELSRYEPTTETTPNPQELRPKLFYVSNKEK